MACGAAGRYTIEIDGGKRLSVKPANLIKPAKSIGPPEGREAAAAEAMADGGGTVADDHFSPPPDSPVAAGGGGGGSDEEEDDDDEDEDEGGGDYFDPRASLKPEAIERLSAVHIDAAAGGGSSGDGDGGKGEERLTQYARGKIPTIYHESLQIFTVLVDPRQTDSGSWVFFRRPAADVDT